MTEKRSAFVIPYTSIDDIPREEYKNLHKAYWNFIAENGLFLKPDIMYANGKVVEEMEYSARCFACAYAYLHSKANMCSHCPITTWRNIYDPNSMIVPRCPCNKPYSLFHRWNYSINAEEKKNSLSKSPT